MDILKLIKKDHDEAFETIEKLEKMTDSPSHNAEKMTQEFAIAVLLHAKSEEKGLYEMIESEKEDFKDFTLEGFIEHSLVENTLKRLLSVKPGGNGEFKAALTVTKELLEHHAKEEEEEELFPKIKKNFSAEERDQMGQLMLAAKEKFRPEIEKMILNQTTLNGKAPAKGKTKMPLAAVKKSPAKSKESRLQ